jgi:hypothetical protein
VEATGANITYNDDLGCYENTDTVPNQARIDWNVEYHPGQGGLVWTPASTTSSTIADEYHPARIAQNGDQPDAPVRGGVDAVSWELMRNSVINEWAAALTPGKIVTDLFTQWVVTFPTKNYYVDLQLDPKPSEDISPTLRPIDSDWAFAPFTEQFPIEGKSCDYYAMDIWNREEQYRGYTSPQKDVPVDLCYEANVVTFYDDGYNTQGLQSAFNVTIDKSLLPTDWDGERSKHGWAQMGFAVDAFGKEVDGAMGALAGLIRDPHEFGKRELATNSDQMADFTLLRLGLPVTGFAFTVYSTGDAFKNHAGINAHKYQALSCIDVEYDGKDVDRSYRDDKGPICWPGRGFFPYFH